MNCTIISVGTEILFGQIVNTNTVYLSQELQNLGFNVLYHSTVGDNPYRLEKMIRESIEDADLIITTGGLGPTQDDLTKETIAKAMGEKLIRHQESYDRLEAFFSKINREMTSNNIKQADMPKNGIALTNDFGTAPGVYIEKNKKIVIALPGPPREMKPMFENYVLPLLKEKSQHVIHSRILRFFGIGESSLESKLEDLVSNQTDPTLATYAKEGEVTLRITSKRETLNEAEKAVNDMIEQVKPILDYYIYSTTNKELNEVVVEKLIEKNMHVSVAESCTGGMLASRFVDVAGVSKVFNRGFVTYSNEAKKDILNVQPQTLDQFGAVSEETAIEMVNGLYSKTNDDVCIAITGIAGPHGGTEEKPVGLVYIAFKIKGETICKSYDFGSFNRQSIRNRVVLTALGVLNKKLNEM